jgi:hypothetical protein
MRRVRRFFRYIIWGWIIISNLKKYTRILEENTHPGRLLRTPYTVFYDRIWSYYMNQYYGRISLWPYTEVLRS